MSIDNIHPTADITRHNPMQFGELGQLREANAALLSENAVLRSKLESMTWVLGGQFRCVD